MRDSDTYLAIFEEGQVIQAKRTIFIIGEERFGPADESARPGSMPWKTSTAWIA
jgi:hypothetical protein